MTSSKRSSGGFFTKESRENMVSHEPQQVRMIVRSGECISTNFVFLEHFAWLYENFAWSCEISFHFSPLATAKIPPGPFRTPVQIFRMFMQNWKTWFFNFFLSFLPFLSLDSTSTTSKSTPNPGPNRLHCFFHYAFGSSSTLFVLFNLIHLFCHQFIKIISWNKSKTS